MKMDITGGESRVRMAHGRLSRSLTATSLSYLRRLAGSEFSESSMFHLDTEHVLVVYLPSSSTLLDLY